jgi:hypothetical protein
MHVHHKSYGRWLRIFIDRVTLSLSSSLVTSSAFGKTQVELTRESLDGVRELDLSSQLEAQAARPFDIFTDIVSDMFNPEQSDSQAATTSVLGAMSASRDSTKLRY